MSPPTKQSKPPVQQPVDVSITKCQHSEETDQSSSVPDMALSKTFDLHLVLDALCYRHGRITNFMILT